MTWYKGMTLYSQPVKANGKEDQASDEGQMSPITDQEGEQCKEPRAQVPEA